MSTKKIKKSNRRTKDSEGSKKHVTPVGANIFEDLGYSPEEAAVLKEQSDVLIAEKRRRIDAGDQSSVQIQLHEIGISKRTLSILYTHGIDTIDALCSLSYDQLRKLPHIGKARVDELLTASLLSG